MNKAQLKNIVIILLASLVAISVFKYLGTLREKYQLQESLAQAKAEVAVLTQEKQNLLQELEKGKQVALRFEKLNLGFKGYLRAEKRRMGRLFQDYSKKENELSDTKAKFSILKAENTALIESHKRIFQENQESRVKLSSIDMLKGIIRDLKMKTRKPSAEQPEGNRGFLIKDGKSTVTPKVKVEVFPAQH